MYVQHMGIDDEDDDDDDLNVDVEIGWYNLFSLALSKHAPAPQRTNTAFPPPQKK